MNFNKITPDTLLNLFNQKDIAIVNTLSDDIFITNKNHNISNCFGMSFIKKNCKSLEKFKLIVPYCANYTCSASRTYAEKLIQKCKSLKDKIVLYEGGVYEWALLSFTFEEQYKFFNNKIKKGLDKNEVEKQFIKMNHRRESSKKKLYPKVVIDNQSNKGNIVFRNNTSGNTMKNKVCVVTGGTSGLGLEVVKKLLDYGARHVTATFFNDSKRAKKVKNELEDKYGNNRIYILKADARTVKGNIMTFDLQFRKKKLGIDVGPIDCVDINAGIFGPANMHKKHIFNISENDYHKTIDINLTGYFLALKYFSKQAIKHSVKDASVVCIKSIYGSTGSIFSNTAYQTSKHGVLGLVHQSALELGRANEQFKIKYPIRVNAVSPTFTDTSLTRPFLNKKLIENTLMKSNPMGRLAYKKDVAEAVIFLLSNKSNSITGTDLPVDCGVLAESIPTYEEVKKLNKAGISELSCCGNKI